MIYATQQDIADIYGAQAVEDALPLDEPDVAGKVAQALRTASLKVDGYLSVRYRLPLSSVPEVLRQPTIDIALYTLAASHTRITDELKDRHDMAIKFLEKIGMGKAGLGDQEPRIQADEGGSTDGSYFSANETHYTRRGRRYT